MVEPLATSSPISTRHNPDSPSFMAFFGKKGSGKSVLARRFWDTWPGDELCIDVTKDALTPADVQETFREPIDRWPAPRREGQPVRIRYTPDMHSSTWRDDCDRAIGLSSLRARTGGCLVWIDEIGTISGVNRTGPYLRHLLNQGRHDKTSALFCGPRPMTIDPLVLGQTDVVYIFELPNPNDRKRIAEVCGIAPDVMDDAVHALPKKGHEYLRWDGQELVHFPPLPLARARPPGRDAELEHESH